jgi:predicted unusual protein kinase regulating ubiquinone biosynthesis (AarF/ABC1/UbiB family)
MGISRGRYKLVAQASIGQVYKVETPGDSIALKVQYPGVETRIRSDFRLLKTLLWPTRLLPLRKSGLLPMLDNLRLAVVDECDYRREARDQQEFHSLFENDEYIRIPRIITCTERAIASEWVSGDDLTQYPQRLDRWFIEAYLTFILKSLKYLHKIHADPHPGNLVITRQTQEANLSKSGRVETDRKLAVLDFGAVAHFSAGEAGAVCRLLLGGYINTAELANDLLALGVSEKAVAAYRPILGDLVSILLEPLYYPGDYDFMGWRLQYKMNTLLGSRAWETPLEIPFKLMLLLRTLQGLYFYARKNFIVFNWQQTIKTWLG